MKLVSYFVSFLRIDYRAERQTLCTEILSSSWCCLDFLFCCSVVERWTVEWLFSAYSMHQCIEAHIAIDSIATAATATPLPHMHGEYLFKKQRRVPATDCIGCLFYMRFPLDVHIYAFSKNIIERTNIYRATDWMKMVIYLFDSERWRVICFFFRVHRHLTTISLFSSLLPTSLLCDDCEDKNNKMVHASGRCIQLRCKW